MSKDEALRIEPIAHIRTPYPEKFGIPRQSGLVPQACGTIEFVSKYRDPDALRGLDAFSHIWLIWGFSENDERGVSALVRPPRLGGNEKRGVFSTRSPFRPNGLGLSAVELMGIEKSKGKGLILKVSGVDLMDKTPIYDIKPYLPYADAYPNAVGGFAGNPDEGMLAVNCPPELQAKLGSDAPGLLSALARDPRPAYHDDPERTYEMRYARWAVRFSVRGEVLEVASIEFC